MEAYAPLLVSHVWVLHHKDGSQKCQLLVGTYVQDHKCIKGVCERQAEDRVLMDSPIAFTFLKLVRILAAIYQKLFGHAASQYASASKAALCVCLYQAKGQLTECNSGSCVAPFKNYDDQKPAPS